MRTATAHAARGDDPLAAVRGLLTELGDPHSGLRVIHIAGSKGKGSTALYAEGLLTALGHRTFTFTSPHLERWTERLRLDGAEAPPGHALAALDAVRGASERSGIVPGFFEALTVAGLWLADAERVDWCVIECGIGGRADATNIIEPAATVITGIEREHVDRLGPDLTDIAREKAGIVKPGAALVAPELAEPLDTLLRETTANAGVEYIRVTRQPVAPARPTGSSTAVWCYDGHQLTAAGTGWRVRTALASPGAHMAGNATLALTVVGQLGIASPEMLQRASRGFARAALPGRTETVSTLPWVIVDGAHTGASAAALAETARTLTAGRIHLLLSCSAGKDVDAILAPLAVVAHAITITRADHEYSAPPEWLADRVRRHAFTPDPVVIDDPQQALAHACTDTPGRTLVLATGSVYLAGLVRAAFSAHARDRRTDA